MTQQTITLAQARRRGWTIERGAYTGTTDDRRDRWYVYRLDAYHAVDRRGPGFATRRAALEALEYHLGAERILGDMPAGTCTACDADVPVRDILGRCYHCAGLD